MASSDFSALIPDFEPLASFRLPENAADMDSATMSRLAHVLPTLRAISRDPGILYNAMLDYLSVARHTAFYSYNADHYHETLEKEYTALIFKHSNLIVALRAVDGLRLKQGRWNIHSLPIEILVLIFSWAEAPFGRNTWHWKSNMGVRAVCRRWRDVMDSTPTLWTHLVLRRRKVDYGQMRVALDRSKNAPLDFVIFPSFLNDQTFDLLLTQMARVRALTFECDTYEDGSLTDSDLGGQSWDQFTEAERERGIRYMHRLMERPAPMLEEFKTRWMHSIPNNIFLRSTPPRLRSVSIIHCDTISSACPLFMSTNLTTLKLWQNEGWCSADDTVVLLGHLPKLRRFKWTMYDSEAELTSVSPQRFGPKSVHLPQLELLQLGIPVGTIAQLIPILHFPTSTELVIRGLSERGVHRNPFPSFKSLSKALHSAFLPHFEALFPALASGYDTMTIRHMKQRDVVPRHAFEVCMEHSTTSQSDVPPSFTYGMSWGSRARDECLEFVLDMLKWPGMTRSLAHIHVDNHEVMTVEAHWQHVMHALPALSAVHVAGLSAPAFFDALRASAALSPNPGSTLDTVIVSKADHATVTSLIQTLDGRVEAGRQKLTIELRFFKTAASVAERLRLHSGVKELRWDGKEYHPEHAYNSPPPIYDEEDYDEEDEV